MRSEAVTKGSDPFRVVAALALAMTLLAPAATASHDGAEAVAETLLDEVLVAGEQAGPGLWKVTRPSADGNHVLWILGTYGPLPEDMKWRSRELESAVSRSQELLAQPEVDPEVGVLRSMALLPSLIGLRHNPDDRRLQDVVPPELYLRWLPLKSRYIGRDDKVERWRPIFAAGELYRKAIEDAGLERSTAVWASVRKLARRHGLRITTPRVEVKVEQARAAVRQFKREPLDDVECFARTIDLLESDLDLMRERAIAWATGDVEALRRSWPRALGSACIGAIMGAGVVQERGYGDMLERVKGAWLAEAERALRENESPIAVLWLSGILDADGYVAALRNRGYAIEDPR
jgi:hypothetical protein